MSIIDIGSSPGGWSQVAAKQIGSIEGEESIVAVDLLTMDKVGEQEFNFRVGERSEVHLGRH